jgi:predicted PurR-regulated permease PerM
MSGFERLRRNLRRALTQDPGTLRSDPRPGGRGNGDREAGGGGWDGPSISSDLVLPTTAVEPAPRGAPVAPVHPSITSRDDADIPRGLRLVTAWAWRLLVLAAAGAVLLWLIGRLRTVLIPLSIALLLSALLAPAVGFLRRRVRLPSSLATSIVVIAGLSAVVGTLTLVVTQFVNGFPSLSDNAADGVKQIQDWLRNGPAHLSNQQLDETLAAAQRWLQENRAALTSSAVSTAAATIEFLALVFLVLFATFFFLRDGRRIWQFLVRLFPAGGREALAGAGEAVWLTLVAYVRATVLVAFIDALGIGLALVIMRVEFAFPLAALVFLAAFVPIVGATVSGSVAVLVALVTRGPLIALLVLLAVIAIQQLEGHVLQPLIMGRAVAIHPLAVIVAIATGVVLAGIIGALVSVPIVAVLNTGIRHVAGRRRGAGPPPDAVVVSAGT